MDPRVDLLKPVLERVFKDNAPRVTKARTADFVFHMTDWIDDLFELAEFYGNPEGTAYGNANSAVMGSIYHIAQHLLAAAKLVDYTPATFDMPE